MSRIYLHLGSNIGSRKLHIARAVQMIEVEVGPILASSAFYETEAWGFPDQDAFLNMALEVEYYGQPKDLLTITQKIESDLGRVKTVVWGPRIIDIDILLFDDIIIDTEQLSIPHKMMANRNFVLFPMCELAPDRVHPIHKKSMKELLDECDDEAYVTVINPEYA